MSSIHQTSPGDVGHKKKLREMFNWESMVKQGCSNMRYFNLSNKVFHSFSQKFSRELVVLHTIVCMFGKLLVDDWSWCGSVNEEHSILVH